MKEKQFENLRILADLHREIKLYAVANGMKIYDVAREAWEAHKLLVQGRNKAKGKREDK